MSIGIIVLLTIGALIFLGAAQRVLDRLYLSDNAALLVIGLIIAGSYIEIPFSQQPLVTANLGGVVIPTLLALYVFSKADTSKEKIRTLVAIVFTSAAIYLVSIYFQNYGEGRDIIDPFYIFILTGGVIAYIVGRTRRGAFTAGVLGYLGYEIINLVQLLRGQLLTQIRIGRGGALDTIVLSGIIAVLLAEIIGESREAILNRNKEEDNEN